VRPVDTYERLLFHGVTAEVWMQDGVTEQNLRQNMAGFYRQASPDGAWRSCSAPGTSRPSCRWTSPTA
jgi:hypothetical protein